MTWYLRLKAFAPAIRARGRMVEKKRMVIDECVGLNWVEERIYLGSSEVKC
jgi:hypothetical protein